MLEAVVSITPPHSWIKRVAATFPAVVRLLDCRSLADGKGVQELFEITSSSESSEKIVDCLRQDDYVYDIDIVKAERGRIIGSLKTHKCTACRTFAEANCFLISANSKPDGKLEWTLLGSDTMIKSLMRRIGKGERSGGSR